MEHENEIYGTCCETHFEDMMVANTFKQLEILLQQLDVIRINGFEIPLELVEKMFKISHLVGARCKFDLCARDGSLSSQFKE
jgi:hypothetical protein